MKIDLEERLVHAAKDGDTDIVRALIALGVDVSANSPEERRTALSYAWENNHREIVDLLIEKGANLDCELADAALCGRLEIVKMLLAKGANANVKDETGCPLIIQLIKHHMDGPTFFHLIKQAPYEECKPIIELLINEGNADVNACDGSGITVLMHAARRGMCDLIEFLIKHGVDIDARNKAEQNDVGEPMKRIPDAIGPIASDSFGYTRWRREKNIRFTDGGTALLDAILYGQINAAETLIAKGADVNIRDDDGCTALMLASSDNAMFDLIGQFIDMVDDVSARDNCYGNSAIVVADSMDIVNLLLDKDASIADYNNDGVTVLMHAASIDNSTLVEGLIARNPELLSIKDKAGKDAFVHAMDNSCYASAKIISHKLIEIDKKAADVLFDEACSRQNNYNNLENNYNNLKIDYDNLNVLYSHQKAELDALRESKSRTPLSEDNVRKLLCLWAESIRDDLEIPNLAAALDIIKTLWPERVLILDSAISSAIEADQHQFQKPQKAFRLLVRVVTRFYEAIQHNGYAAARREFLTNRQLATNNNFDIVVAGDANDVFYGNTKLNLHLRIGNRGPDTCWRAYFGYEHKDKKIIIGHCGMHLTSPNGYRYFQLKPGVNEVPDEIRLRRNN